MTFPKRSRKKVKIPRTSKHLHLWPELELMPPLDHWPNRQGPYRPQARLRGVQSRLAPHGGTITRGNVAQVAAAMKCSERTAWSFRKKLKTNDS